MSIEPGEKEMVQRASKMVNDQLKELKKTYSPEQKSDYLAMASLMLSMEVVKKEQELEAAKKLSEDLSALESKLDSRGRK